MTEHGSTYTDYRPPQHEVHPGDDDASMKDKAAESAQTGKQAAGEVAQTAAGQAKEVVGEAQSQARNLVGEARDQLRSHAGDQHRNAVSNLRSLGDELRAMAGSGQGGMATDLVSQGADRTHGAADWLEARQPEDLLEELRTFARRRPGTFLLGALAAGVVAGRLTRGAVAAHTDDTSSGTGSGTGSLSAPAAGAAVPPPAVPAPPTVPVQTVPATGFPAPPVPAPPGPVPPGPVPPGAGPTAFPTGGVPA